MEIEASWGYQKSTLRERGSLEEMHVNVNVNVNEDKKTLSKQAWCDFWF